MASMNIPEEAEKQFPHGANDSTALSLFTQLQRLAFAAGAEWARREALREAAAAVRANAGAEDEYGICEGVSGWPIDAARTYSHATHEAIESIDALAEGDSNE
jgi:hypothetical protein